MNETSWIIYGIVFVGLIAFIRMRRGGQVSKKEAVEYVKRGAIIVDVRSAAEYQRGHLSQAYNMPVEDVASLLPQKVRDRDKAILVHCQSGMRSKKAKDQLTRIGYTNVHDLGSYERAFKIVSGRNL
jgi:phage shock protein E